MRDVAGSAESLDGPRTAALAEAAAAAGAWLAAGSVPERDGADIYNTAMLFGRDGELRGVHRKAHLYAPLGEDLIFTAGPCLTVCPTEDFGPLGLPVCFDGDFPETARALRLAGARVIVQASAYEAEAESWWDGLYPARALENGQWWVMSNQCGRTPSGALLGGSQIISPLGRVVSRAVKVHELAGPTGPALLVAEIALRQELAEADRLNSALWENRREDLPAGFYSFGTFKGTPFLLEMGAVLSYQLTWAPYVSEYSRYLPRSSSTAATFWWTYIGSGIGVLWLAGLGAFLAAAYPKIASPVTAIHVAGNSWFHGWGYIVLLCSWPGLIAVLGLNMYSGGLSTLTTIDTIKPVKPTLTLRVLAITFIAVAGTVLALTIPGSFLTNFSSFLTIILYFMIPWTAVNLIDFFFVRKGNYAIKEIFKPNGMYHRWGWRGLSAYWLGFFAMAPFMSTTLYTGFVAKDLGGGDISPFIGFPVAAILYWIFCRNLDVQAEKRVAEQQMHEVDPEGAIGLGTS